VTEELSLDIRIALLGHKGHSPKTVYSHFTQIKHHREWLASRHPKAKLVATTSTTLAAEKAAATKNAAALAAPGTASIYDLDVLEQPAGSEVNVTSFFVIALADSTSKKANRTALVAALKNQCGSLHRFLGPFSREEVSLTRIVSRPVPGQPQTYVFYIEIEGSQTSPRVQRALDLASRHARSITLLGSFPLGRRFRS
jgi:chorismate mutase/prephenate dehydratase